MNQTPKSQAGRELRDEVIEALSKGFPDEVVRAPAWPRAGHGTVTVLDMLEANMDSGAVAEVLRIVALAAGGSDLVSRLAAQAFIARQASYHAWMHESDIVSDEEPERVTHDPLQLDDATRALFRRVGGFNL